MKKKIVLSISLVSIIILSMSIGAFAATNMQKIEVYLNKGLTIKLNGEALGLSDPSGKTIFPITYNGTTYLPVRSVGEAAGLSLEFDNSTNTVLLTSPPVPAGNSTQQPTQGPTDKPVDQPQPPVSNDISQNDLPYTVNAKNGMSLTINSFTASSGGVSFNVTISNNSTVSDKGDLMTSTWEIYDGKNTLKFLDQDQSFWDTEYVRSGQSVTGNISFQGISNPSAKTFTLYGKLWQYIDAEEFKIVFAL